jgi:cell division protein FtsL
VAARLELGPERRLTFREHGMRESNGAFVACWTLAVAAATAAFCVHLTLRVRAIELGYEMGRIHAQLGRLREVRRVLELEVASYQTPERVDLVARTLLGMAPPGVDRMLHAAPLPKVLDAEREAGRRGVPLTAQRGEESDRP